MSENVNEIILSDKAVIEIKKIMDENDVPAEYGLRVGIKGGGCSGFTYIMNFDAQSREADTVLTQDGINIYVDGKSLFYLTGTTLDFQNGLNGKGFVFNNPNAQKTCGCGDSFGV